MPLFEYKCQDCNNVEEHLESASDKSVHTCAKCGGTNTKRVFGAFSANVVQESGANCSSSGSCPTGMCPFAKG